MKRLFQLEKWLGGRVGLIIKISQGKVGAYTTKVDGYNDLSLVS